jgi:hypothetical protein
VLQNDVVIYMDTVLLNDAVLYGECCTAVPYSNTIILNNAVLFNHAMASDS